MKLTCEFHSIIFKEICAEMKLLSIEMMELERSKIFNHANNPRGVQKLKLYRAFAAYAINLASTKSRLHN
jgi:hemoglobin-like flavoprotein